MPLHLHLYSIHTGLGLVGPPGPTAGGVVYTRWERTTCKSISGTQLVYTGIAAGSAWQNSGGSANSICLPNDPSYLQYTTGRQIYHDYIYGSEYLIPNGPLFSVHTHSVPCAVCYVSTRGTVLMMPGKPTCPSSWTREYYGYLTSDRYNHHRKMYECVDKSPESIPESAGDIDGSLFVHVEATYSGVPCPPYTAGRELACAVCTL